MIMLPGISFTIMKTMNYVQDVDWKELVKLPKFKGATPTYFYKSIKVDKSGMGQHKD